MKTITAAGIILQFDGDQVTDGTAMAQVNQAINLINQTLQREPHGLAAQIMPMAAPWVSVEDSEEECT